MEGLRTLAVCSHKGGTGKTTTALALSWLWGQSGASVNLIDVGITRAASLIAAGPNGVCFWKGVKLRGGLPDMPLDILPGDINVIDCAPLADPVTKAVLSQADAVLLCCRADLMALRTLPAVVKTLASARTVNPRLRLKGVAVTRYRADDAAQAEVMQELAGDSAGLLIGAPVPWQREVYEWPLRPQNRPPAGPALYAYEEILAALKPAALAGV